MADSEPVVAVCAAGGIVWRDGPSGREVLVVHRHKPDWTLPKGHLEAGEDFVDAARREVREETGYEVEPTQLADLTVYDVDGRPKAVAFWHMTLLRPQPVAGPEVGHTPKWLPVGVAIETLTYPDQKRLLAVAAVRYGTLPRTPRWARTGLYRRRLFGSLRVRSEALLRTAAEARERGDDTSWVVPALALLDAAREAAGRPFGQDEAWRCLHAAERLEVLGFEKVDVASGVAALRCEAEKKLGEWRREAVLSILREARGRVLPADRRRLAMALAVRDEHSGNVHHTNALVVRHVLAQVAVLFTALVVVGWLLGRPWLDLADPVDIGGYLVLAVACTGAAGGAMSNLQRIASAQMRGRVPEQALSLALAAVRPLVGAFAALVVYVLLAVDVLRWENRSVGTAIAFGFAAGFTERFFTGAVEKLAGGTG